MIRVVHVIGSLKPGGAETWYMNILRQLDRSRYHTTFCCLFDEKGLLEDEASSLGAEIAHVHRNPSLHRFCRQFRRFLGDGRFDVVHAQVQFFSGVVLSLARRVGVPIRVAHAHSAGDLKETTLFRRAYLALMRRYIRRSATCLLAVSTLAADFLYGRGAAVHMLPAGIDANRFVDLRPRRQVRAELGLPLDTPIVGHVGNLRKVKNHRFFLNVAAELVTLNPAVRFVLVGEGEEEPALRLLAAELGIADRVVFAGSRNDVPDLLGAFDLMVFPSMFEGLPLAVVEAQCAGLPTLLSDVIAREVEIIPELVAWESLQSSPRRWSQVAVELLRRPRYDSNLSLQIVRNSRFEFNYHLGVIEKIYSGEIQ